MHFLGLWLVLTQWYVKDFFKNFKLHKDEEFNTGKEHSAGLTANTATPRKQIGTFEGVLENKIYFASLQ